MDEALQRYLDGITALLSLVVGGLFALGLPVRFQEAAWLLGLGVAGVVWTAVAAYQRDAFGEDDAADDATAAAE